MKYVLLSALLASNIYADTAPDIVTIGNAVAQVNTATATLNVISGGIFSVLTHGEVEYGKGKFAMSGAFLGLNESISDTVTTYTLKAEHTNTLIKHLNYNYKINWYDSQKINQPISTYNGYVSNVNGYTGNALTIPSLNYKVRGLDADIGLGWNIIDISEHDYFSIGPDIGISLPWIEATGTSSSSSSNSSASLLSNTGTKISTYKAGVQMRVAKSLTSYLSLYASSIYAYQIGKLTNSNVNLDINVHGIFNENEIGLRYQPLEYSYKLTSWLSISPQLYFTAGARYTQWVINNVSVNLFNQNIPLAPTDLKMNASAGYIGVGYSFF